MRPRGDIIAQQHLYAPASPFLASVPSDGVVACKFTKGRDRTVDDILLGIPRIAEGVDIADRPRSEQGAADQPSALP
ncbi:hypothetical protein CIK64_14500 [Brevibacterium aurantiacum]|uniref:Uncharacterized protein n=1 Tax=Brevibacterium aurantiacum TaxID=273384 RepID=A0A2A3Z299_BREAU|nr:hypothetical protein CIK64_14500 [Brevibacterium aurantiacum]